MNLLTFIIKNKLSKSFIISTGLLILSLCSATYAEDVVHFNTPEHVYAGDLVQLRFDNETTPGSHFNYIVQKKQLTYGELVAFPDYLGDPSRPISLGKTTSDRNARFLSLVKIINEDKYFNNVLSVMRKQNAEIKKALREKKDVAQTFHKLAKKYAVNYAVATHLRYIPLVMHDFDHFMGNAILAYQAGHAVAVKHAIQGYDILRQRVNSDTFHAIAACQQVPHSQYTNCLKKKANDMLRLAYAENAIANHYLSDRFSSGHMRDPYYYVYYSTKADRITSALSGNIMHDEDCKNGLIVKNSRGEQWIAYGDAYYFSQQNKENKARLLKTMQLSADEIYEAYTKGKDTDLNSIYLLTEIPDPLLPGTTFQGKVQTEPLFTAKSPDGDKIYVYERKSICDPYNFGPETSHWSALKTVVTHEVECPSPVSRKTSLIKYIGKVF